MSGSLVDCDVTVNISHTYKGDLEVYLQRPDGEYILLHNNTGGSANNIQTTYDTQTNPTQPMSNLFGGSPNGTWRLWAFDLAAQDTGSILSWSLDVLTDAGGGGGGGGPTTQTWNSSNVPLSIPDNNGTGITSNLTIGGTSGTITECDITVNITHTYKGDLLLELYHPDGQKIILHNQTGGSANNIQTTFDEQTSPVWSMNLVNGKPLNGTWQLRVKDLAAQDLGTLNSWSLTMTYE